MKPSAEAMVRRGELRRKCENGSTANASASGTAAAPARAVELTSYVNQTGHWKRPIEPPPKLCNTRSLPVMATLKTVPSFFPPPKVVVPYNVPFTLTKPASGAAPSEPPPKLYSTFSVPRVLTLKPFRNHQLPHREPPE